MNIKTKISRILLTTLMFVFNNKCRLNPRFLKVSWVLKNSRKLFWALLSYWNFWYASESFFELFTFCFSFFLNLILNFYLFLSFTFVLSYKIAGRIFYRLYTLQKIKGTKNNNDCVSVSNIMSAEYVKFFAVFRRFM
jgi:hypothetical protein